MAEIDDDILGDAVGALKQATETEGESSEKIIRSEASTFGKRQKKPDPNSGPAKIFYTKIATIFGETFQKIKEANEEDTALKTDIQQDTPAGKAAAQAKAGKKASLGLIGTIGLIIAGVVALAMFLKDKLSPLQERLLAAFKFLGPVFDFLFKIGDDIVKFFKEGKIAKLLTKMPGAKFLMGIASKVGGKIAKVLKFIPFVGSLINFGFAIMRFKEGDIFGGILEVLAGIGGLLPPPFFLIGMALEGIILARDLMGEEEDGSKKFDNKIKSAGGFLKDIASKIGGFISKNLRNLPVVGALVLQFEAAQAFLRGDFKEGFTKFGTSILAFGLGAKGAEMVIDGVGFVIDFIKGIAKPDNINFPSFDTIKKFISNIGAKIGQFFINIRDSIAEFFAEWFSNFSFENILQQAKDAFSFVGDAITSVIDGIFNAVKNLGSWLAENIPFPSFDTIKNIFGFLKDLLFGIPGKVIDIAKDLAGKAKKFVGGIIDFVTGKDEEEIEEELSKGKTVEFKEVTLPDFSVKLMEDLVHVQRLAYQQSVTSGSYLKGIHTEMKMLNRDIEKIAKSGTQSPIIQQASNRTPINNDGEIPDTRADYGLSPYSISVA